MSNEQNLYIIKWVNKITGATGYDTKAFPYHLVELQVKELNKKYAQVPPIPQ